MNFSLLNKNLFSLIIVILTFFADRLSKNKIIDDNLENKSVYINEYLNFDLVWNTGIGFGLLNLEANIYYHLVSFIIFLIIVFLIYLTLKANLIERICFSLILGGALGNFYDRAFYFGVPDFIDLHYNEFHWFTFNIADIFISVGIVIIIIKEFFIRK